MFRTGAARHTASGRVGRNAVGTKAKLLRVLEDSCVRRLGGKSEIVVDVRVIASTNKVLEDALRKGESREDLYCRLSVFTMLLPGLAGPPW